MEVFYITKDPAQAGAVQAAGVDRVMVDLEINGKDARQGHLNTVISRHTPDDVTAVREVLDKTALMVRVNPVFAGSAAEIDDCIARGADWLMLPMFTAASEVAKFLDMVNGRVRTTLLLETPTALARINDILDVGGIDEVHLGLNDLHLGLKLDFMFEVLSEGLADYAAAALRDRDIPFGIGGVARLGGQGALPADLILSEHCRLGSTRSILSRDFGAIFADHPDDSTALFAAEVAKLRTHVATLDQSDRLARENARLRVRQIVRQIVRDIVRAKQQKVD